MAEEENNQEEVKQDSPKAKSSGDLKGLGIVGKIVGGAVIVWLISVSYYAFAFFSLGMLPSILSIIIDRGSGKFASKTVSACNFIAMAPYLFDIALSFERDILAKQLMNDTTTWLIIYGFATVGWMLIWILPNITLIIFTVRADVRRKNLLVEQETLLDEWGPEIKTGKARRVNS